MITRRKIFVPETNVAIETSDKFDEKLSSPTEVLIRNKYSHISAGTELACIAGLESFFTIPDTPGYTAVGEVMEIGIAVSKVKKGDLVYTYGPHAEYFKIDTNDRWHGICVKIPDGSDPELAAFTHMAGIAITALRNSSVELGDYVLVTGLGAIGNIVAQLAQMQGATVIATDINDKRIEIAKQCGIGIQVNSMKENLSEIINELTQNKLVSTYIDASGSAKVVNESVNYVALNGETILLGSPRAKYETNLTTFLQHYHNLPWNHTIKGALEFTFPTHEDEFSKHSIERNARIILGLIDREELIIKPFYSHKIQPGEIQSAYDGLRHNPEKYIGVIIDWT